MKDGIIFLFVMEGDTVVKEAKLVTAVHYTHQNVVVEPFHFADLARQDTWLNPAQLAELRQQTGLTDLYWRTLYYKKPFDRNPTLTQALAEAEGYVFFLHGWDGSHRIWEDLPVRLAISNQRLVCFNLDVNGFGLSPFSSDTPSAEQCNPSALMAAIEFWLAALKLWPTPRRHKPFYLFVGHSMGGAALFYKSEINWSNEVYGLYALAPALFCNDVQRQAFFKTVGLSIALPSFSALKTALAPHIMEIMAAGASLEVKNEHVRVFARTPFGTLAQTLYVLGANPVRPERTDWPRFRVALGHKDRLVGVDNMLQLLSEFGLHPDQIRVMLGDHYFFSHDDSSPATHKENRRIIFEDLLAFCSQLAQEARANSA